MPLPGFERVASFPTAAEAEVVRGLLAASGIEAHVAATNHLEREHFPGGEVAVLVRAEEVARARELVASARVPDEPGAAPPGARRAPLPWTAALAVGLVLLAAGAAMLGLGPGVSGAAEACLAAGAVLAAAGALGGRGERRDRARRRE